MKCYCWWLYIYRGHLW